MCFGKSVAQIIALTAILVFTTNCKRSNRSVVRDVLAVERHENLRPTYVKQLALQYRTALAQVGSYRCQVAKSGSTFDQRFESRWQQQRLAIEHLNIFPIVPVPIPTNDTCSFDSELPLANSGSVVTRTQDSRAWEAIYKVVWKLNFDALHQLILAGNQDDPSLNTMTSLLKQIEPIALSETMTANDHVNARTLELLSLAHFLKEKISATTANATRFIEHLDAIIIHIDQQRDSLVNWATHTWQLDNPNFRSRALSLTDDNMIEHPLFIQRHPFYPILAIFPDINKQKEIVTKQLNIPLLRWDDDARQFRVILNLESQTMASPQGLYDRLGKFYFRFLTPHFDKHHYERFERHTTRETLGKSKKPFANSYHQINASEDITSGSFSRLCDSVFNNYDILGKAFVRTHVKSLQTTERYQTNWSFIDSPPENQRIHNLHFVLARDLYRTNDIIQYSPRFYRIQFVELPTYSGSISNLPLPQAGKEIQCSIPNPVIKSQLNASTSTVPLVGKTLQIHRQAKIKVFEGHLIAAIVDRLDYNKYFPIDSIHDVLNNHIVSALLGYPIPALNVIAGDYESGQSLALASQEKKDQLTTIGNGEKHVLNVPANAKRLTDAKFIRFDGKTMLWAQFVATAAQKENHYTRCLWHFDQTRWQQQDCFNSPKRHFISDDGRSSGQHFSYWHTALETATAGDNPSSLALLSTFLNNKQVIVKRFSQNHSIEDLLGSRPVQPSMFDFSLDLNSQRPQTGAMVALQAQRQVVHIPSLDSILFINNQTSQDGRPAIEQWDIPRAILNINSSFLNPLIDQALDHNILDVPAIVSDSPFAGSIAIAPMRHDYLEASYSVDTLLSNHYMTDQAPFLGDFSNPRFQNGFPNFEAEKIDVETLRSGNVRVKLDFRNRIGAPSKTFILPQEAYEQPRYVIFTLIPDGMNELATIEDSVAHYKMPSSLSPTTACQQRTLTIDANQQFPLNPYLCVQVNRTNTHQQVAGSLPTATTAKKFELEAYFPVVPEGTYQLWALTPTQAYRYKGYTMKRLIPKSSPDPASETEEETDTAQQADDTEEWPMRSHVAAHVGRLHVLNQHATSIALKLEYRYMMHKILSQDDINVNLAIRLFEASDKPEKKRNNTNTSYEEPLVYRLH